MKVLGDPERRGRCAAPEPAASGSGTAYLMQRREERRRKEEVGRPRRRARRGRPRGAAGAGRRRAACAARRTASSPATTGRWSSTAPTSSSAARPAACDALVGELAERLTPSGARIELGGPFPPYSVVPERIVSAGAVARARGRARGSRRPPARRRRRDRGRDHAGGRRRRPRPRLAARARELRRRPRSGRARCRGRARRCDRAARDRRRHAGAGGAGAGRPGDGLAVLCAPAAEGEADAETLWRREALLEALMEQGALLPVRYGTVGADEAAAVEAVPGAATRSRARWPGSAAPSSCPCGRSAPRSAAPEAARVHATLAVLARDAAAPREATSSSARRLPRGPRRGGRLRRGTRRGCRASTAR